MMGVERHLRLTNTADVLQTSGHKQRVYHIVLVRGNGPTLDALFKRVEDAWTVVLATSKLFH
jgi:hypothetical protein